MSAISAGETKRLLRAGALSRRNALTRTQIFSLGRAVQDTVLGFAPYLQAQAISLYSPIEAEVATQAIRDHAWAAGKKVFYPKTRRGTDPELAQARFIAELRPGRYGIFEPVGDRHPDPDEEAFILFVPGVAFDPSGNRLGRGAGWYDRLLKPWEGRATFVGLAYDFQLVGEVPEEAWDIKVHYVITDRKIVACRPIATAGDETLRTV